MQVTHDSSPGYHPNARVEMSHPSSMSRMSQNEVRMMLFGPLTFKIGPGGDDGVGLVVHVGKVGDKEEVGMTEER